MTASPRLSLSLMLAVVACACGSSDRMNDAGADGSTPDAAPDVGAPDLGAPDLGIVYPPGTTCDDPMVVMGSATAATSASFDTTSSPPGMRDLGLACGNADPGMGGGRFAPQVVVEYHVAGTGSQRVDFTMVNAGTTRTIDTVVQVRTACTTVPPDAFPFTCFDDSSTTELRSSGSVVANGGDTLFFLLTGYTDTTAMGYTDRGPLQIDFTQTAGPHAPTLTTVAAYYLFAATGVDATGGDVDGDARGLLLQPLDATGTAVDLTGDGTADTHDLVFLGYGPGGTLSAVAPDVDGMTTFTGEWQRNTLAGRSSHVTLAAHAVTQASLRMFDRGGLTSAAMTVPVADYTTGAGGSCDTMHRCVAPATCGATSMTCDLPAAASAACSAATPIVVPTPTTATTSATVAGTTPGATTGLFVFSALGQCGTGNAAAAAGGESLFTVTVPAGHYDLILSTERSASGTDTILYVWRTCGDPSSEAGCQDDLPSGDTRSRVEVRNATAGDYTAVVEKYGGGAAAFSLEASLRPVLDPGAPCTGTTDRCSGGACPASHVCP